MHNGDRLHARFGTAELFTPLRFKMLPVLVSLLGLKSIPQGNLEKSSPVGLDPSKVSSKLGRVLNCAGLNFGRRQATFSETWTT